MKVAQIIYTGFGGLGSVAFSLIEADQARQHKWLMGFIGDTPIDESYPKRCYANGVPWKEFPSIAGRPYHAWWALARWLDEAHPDVIILHSINSILPCRWQAWRQSIPLIAVEHTPNAVKTSSEWMASRLCMVLADRVILLTKDYERELADAHHILYRAGKVTVIPNGIDTSAFRPSESNMRMRSIIRLGMAARFSFSKRQDILVEMMSELRTKYPKVQWRLGLAGDGVELERIQRVVARLGLLNLIQLEGLLDEAGLAEWLRELDIYVHASDAETLSTSLLQAMATGLPIVASDVPGIRNLLAHEANLGTLVANDPAQFAELVAVLANNPQRRKEMGCRAREACISSYSHFGMLDAYVRLIREMRSPP